MKRGWWPILCGVPLIVGVLRVVHFHVTGYVLPDESTYLYSTVNYFQTGRVVYAPSRLSMQFLMLGLSVLFNLSSVERLFTFFPLFFAGLSCLIMYLCVKIVEHHYPEFADQWVVPVLLLLSPAFVVMSPLILTELLGIFFTVVTIYMFVIGDTHPILLGVMCGGAYIFREPYLLLPIIVSLYFVKHRMWTHLGGFITTFSLFFYMPGVYGITPWLRSHGVYYNPSLFIRGLFWIVERFTGFPMLPESALRQRIPYGFLSPPTLQQFAVTSTLNFVVMSVFSIGVFAMILSVWSIVQRSDGYRWILLGIGLMVFSCLYMSRSVVYSILFMSKIGTAIRFGVVAIFMVPFTLHSIIDRWDSRIIRRFIVCAVLGSTVVAMPFVSMVQSNLSVNGVNRLSFDYTAPWLYAKRHVSSINPESVAVIVEPWNRIRLFQVNGVHYEQLSSNRSQIDRLRETYGVVLLYGELHPYYWTMIRERHTWYDTFLRDPSNYAVIHDNNEFYLYQVVMSDDDVRW